MCVCVCMGVDYPWRMASPVVGGTAHACDGPRDGVEPPSPVVTLYCYVEDRCNVEGVLFGGRADVCDSSDYYGLNNILGCRRRFAKLRTLNGPHDVRARQDDDGEITASDQRSGAVFSWQILAHLPVSGPHATLHAESFCKSLLFTLSTVFSICFYLKHSL